MHGFRWAVAGLTLLVWSTRVPVATSGAAAARRPGFTLEDAVRVRTIGHVAVSPDGRLVAFGLAGHYFGFPVVPRFGDDSNLRVLDVRTGDIRQATSGTAAKIRPVFSPDGQSLAYESEGDLWIVRLADGRTRRVTTHGAADTRAAWSPDGSRLAFLSTRDGGTDVWVVSTDGEPHGLRRVTSDRIAKDGLTWSPDGARLAYSARGPLDFYASSIVTVSPAGGAPQRLTPEDEFEYAHPRWSPDGRHLAFMSDRSGYTHVWIARADGSDLRHLDHGPNDAESPYFDVVPHWSSDGRRVLVSRSVEGRFDLLDVSAANGAVTVLRTGAGQFRAVGWSHDARALYLQENAWTPPALHVDVDGTKGRALVASTHVSFIESHFASRRRERAASPDGVSVPLMVLTPREMTPGERLPAILALHPNGDGQFFDYWSPFFDYLAASGYVVVMVDQRGSSGYGRAFRTAQIGQWGQGTFEDVKTAAQFTKALPYVAADRMGVMGLSFGGYQTLLALTKTPDLFAAGVDLMGPTDRRGRPGDRYRELQIGASEAEAPDLYERISPITSVAALKAPLLIIHSDQDRNVPPEETYRLQNELDRLGKAYDVVIYPGEAHGLADPAHQLDSYRRMISFFDRWLRR